MNRHHHHHQQQHQQQLQKQHQQERRHQQCSIRVVLFFLIGMLSIVTLSFLLFWLPARENTTITDDRPTSSSSSSLMLPFSPLSSSLPSSSQFNNSLVDHNHDIYSSNVIINSSTTLLKKKVDSTNHTISTRTNNNIGATDPQNNNANQTTQTFHCFQYNSKRWIQEQTQSKSKEQQDNNTNAKNKKPPPTVVWNNDDFMTHNFIDFVMSVPTISSNLDFLIGQTICSPTSSLHQSLYNDNYNNSNNDYWKFIQLLYASIHWYHHKPAYKEYKANRYCIQSNHTTMNNIFSMECSDAKFLVTANMGIGFGATVRLSLVQHLLMAISLNRIPVFVSNTQHYGPIVMKKPWQLASCPNRKDIQCIYQPISPCTILQDELQSKKTPYLTELETRYILVNGTLPPHIDDSHRVIMIPRRSGDAKLDRYTKSTTIIKQRLYQIMMQISQIWNKQQKQQQDESNSSTGSSTNWTQIAEMILVQNDPSTNQKFSNNNYIHTFNNHSFGDYGHRYYTIAHVLELYLLRPNLQTKQILQNRLANITSLYPITDHSKIIGMPIRGSDKCDHESICLPFETYMKLAHETFINIQNNNDDDDDKANHHFVMITTEDVAIYNASTKFKKQQRQQQQEQQSHANFDLLLNPNDIFQGTGKGRDYGQQADEIMISSLIALQLQLHYTNSVVYGNCCSNFHKLLFDLYNIGCGSDTSYTQCLQETTKSSSNEKEYYICCAWSRDSYCRTKRNQWQLDKQQQNNINVTKQVK